MVDSGDEQLSYFTQLAVFGRAGDSSMFLFFPDIKMGAFLKVSAMLSEREREGAKHLSSTFSWFFEHQPKSIHKKNTRLKIHLN